MFTHVEGTDTSQFIRLDHLTGAETTSRKVIMNVSLVLLGLHCAT